MRSDMSEGFNVKFSTRTGFGVDFSLFYLGISLLVIYMLRANNSSDLSPTMRAGCFSRMFILSCFVLPLFFVQSLFRGVCRSLPLSHADFSRFPVFNCCRSISYCSSIFVIFWYELCRSFPLIRRFCPRFS